GTTETGGGDPTCYARGGCGTVFKLTHSGGQWTESVLYGFTRNGPAGWIPLGGVVLDASGNIYGTSNIGAGGCGGKGRGAVWELSFSGSQWNIQTLHSFQSGLGGANPFAGVTFDTSGNLLGATADAGSSGGGTLFELSPTGSGWDFNLLYSFFGNGGLGPL